MAIKPIPFPLSSQDKTVSALLNEAVTQQLSRLSIDPDLMNEASAFLLELTGQSMLHLFLTTDGIAQYHEKVFTSSNIRDMIYGIYSSFIARYSNDEDELQALNELIARSATIVTKNSQASLIPEVLGDRLMDYEDILEQLDGNPWIVIISLILLYWNHGMILSHAKQR